MSIDNKVLDLKNYFSRARAKYPNLYDTRQKLEKGLMRVNEIYQEKLDALFYCVAHTSYEREVMMLLKTAINVGYEPKKLVSYLREDYPFLGQFSRKSKVQSKSL